MIQAISHQLEGREANSEVCHWVRMRPPHGLAFHLPLHLSDGFHHGLLGDQTSLLLGSHMATEVAVETQVRHCIEMRLHKVRQHSCKVVLL